ncbi:hypothetical protein H4S02_004339, partial [Coemansia sp. RSA 2611]
TAEPQQQTAEPEKPADSASESERPRDAEAGRTRSRRGTNAARYVPGVGFVSDDGVSATSPQLLSGPAFKTAASGALRSGGLGSGRMSPLPSRLVASRPQSPLVGGKAVDSEQVAQLQSMLLAGPAEAVERVVGGLAAETAAALAVLALGERRRLGSEAAQWQASVGSVLQTYDAIAGQLDGFRRVCEAQDAESGRLAAELAESQQTAEAWRVRYERAAAELAQLKGQQQQQRGFAFGNGAPFAFQFAGGNPAYNPMYGVPVSGAAENEASAAASASLLTALNAASQPF